METNYIELKQQMLKIMQHLSDYTANNPKLLLPQPDINYVTSKGVLEKAAFNLVVCGKVKNGKSSLINALIGKNILPVCTSVATSQTFKISNAKTDSCAIIYTNGDKKSIDISELAAYGSQNAIDKEGLRETNRSISYIEVNTPADFIPQDVSIIDTPGIGATYPQHTLITKQSIQLADAVLFVLNPSPLEKIELDFLKEIVEITPNIMFVMTKIDNNGEESVNTNIKRNKEQIEKAIGSKLWQDVNIFQMSSTMLADANNDADTAEYAIQSSGYPEVKDGILQLVSLTQGYYRVGNAYNAALTYFNTVLQSIKNRISVAEAQGVKTQQLQQQVDEARRKLNEFGNQKRTEIFEKINVRIRAFESEFYQNMSSSSSIAQKYYDEIDLLDSNKNLEEYNNTLAEKLLSDLQDEWNRLTKMLNDEISNIIAEYNSSCNTMFDSAIALPNAISQGEKANLDSVTLRNRFVHMRNDAMLGVGGLTILSFTPLGAIPVVGPILALGAIAYASYGLFSGNVRAKAEVLAKNKNALKNFVKDVIIDFKKQYTEVSLENGQYESIIDGYKTSTRQYAEATLSEIYNFYSNEVKALEETLQSNKGESLILLKSLQEKWEQNKNVLLVIRGHLENIDKQLKK